MSSHHPTAQSCAYPHGTAYHALLLGNLSFPLEGTEQSMRILPHVCCVTFPNSCKRRTEEHVTMRMIKQGFEKGKCWETKYSLLFFFFKLKGGKTANTNQSLNIQYMQHNFPSSIPVKTSQLSRWGSGRISVQWSCRNEM